MQERSIRRVPIVTNGRLVRIVSLGNVRAALPSSVPASRADERRRPDSTLCDAARIMLEHKAWRLSLMAGCQLVDIITESDIFRVLTQDLPPSD
jgi:CBS domain-containing protein